MGIKKIIINIILKIANIFVLRCSIKQGQIAFISLESNQLESDLELIYQELKKENKYSLKMVLINYNKKSLINNFLYMLNCIKQIYVINTSKVVLITDNNLNLKVLALKLFRYGMRLEQSKSLEMLSNVNILLKIMTM